ncbi:MAG TPA: hypothetical protein VL068_06830 [Microthrixaceae bacterium]|nr:hypothetical protein [Microthrixaceae bacterium]
MSAAEAFTLSDPGNGGPSAAPFKAKERSNSLGTADGVADKAGIALKFADSELCHGTENAIDPACIESKDA